MNSRERLKVRAQMIVDKAAFIARFGISIQDAHNVFRDVCESFNRILPALVEKMHEWADALREIDIEAVQHKLAELKGEQHESE